MKGYYISTTFNDFIDLLEKICLSEKKLKISITFLAWQNGDYFKEFCEEDGGIIQEHLIFFKEISLGKKVNCFSVNYFSDLKMILDSARKITFLSSKNGNFKLFYDIHILLNRHYYCYNIYLNKYYYRFQNFFQHILSMFVFPEWIDITTGFTRSVN
jgi:hypothetical protein